MYENILWGGNYSKNCLGNVDGELSELPGSTSASFEDQFPYLVDNVSNDFPKGLAFEPIIMKNLDGEGIRPTHGGVKDGSHLGELSDDGGIKESLKMGVDYGVHCRKDKEVMGEEGGVNIFSFSDIVK